MSIFIMAILLKISYLRAAIGGSNVIASKIFWTIFNNHSVMTFESRR